MGFFEALSEAVLLGLHWDLAFFLGSITVIVGAALSISTLGAAGIVLLVGAALLGIGGLGVQIRLLNNYGVQRGRINGIYTPHVRTLGKAGISAMAIWSVHASSWPEIFALKLMKGQYGDFFEACEDLLKSDNSTKGLWSKAVQDWCKRCCEALNIQEKKEATGASSKSSDEWEEAISGVETACLSKIQ